MKKFAKFIFTTLSIAACVGGAYYFVKNILNKNTKDDFDSFEDDFDVFDCDEDKEEDSVPSDDRGYVTLNFQEEEEIDFDTPKETAAETNEEEAVSEEKKEEPQA